MIWTPAPFDLVGMLVDIGRPETVEVYRCQESYKTCPGRRGGFKEHYQASKHISTLGYSKRRMFLIKSHWLALEHPHAHHPHRPTSDVEEGHWRKARNMRPGRGIFLLKGLAVEQKRLKEVFTFIDRIFLHIP